MGDEPQVGMTPRTNEHDIADTRSCDEQHHGDLHNDSPPVAKAVLEKVAKREDVRGIARSTLLAKSENR